MLSCGNLQSRCKNRLWLRFHKRTTIFTLCADCVNQTCKFVVTFAMDFIVFNDMKSKHFSNALRFSSLYCTSGVGNLFTIAGRMNCILLLVGRKINSFYPKILPLCNYKEEWLFLTYYLSTCLLWRFVLTPDGALTRVRKNLMRAKSNFHAGRRFPPTCFTSSALYVNQSLKNWTRSTSYMRASFVDQLRESVSKGKSLLGFHWTCVGVHHKGINTKTQS